MKRGSLVRRAVGLARGLHKSANHQHATSTARVMSTPGDWTSGCGEREVRSMVYSSMIDLVGPSHDIGFSRLLASGRRRINSNGASQKRRRVLEWE